MVEGEKLKSSQREDHRSIEEICADTWESVYRFIYYKVQNRQEAEEITQETYAKALSYLKENETKIDKYAAYLKTISLNVLRDKWRKSRRQGQIVDIEAINPEEIAVDDSADSSADRALIRSALKKLNEEQRKVIELRILKGYSAAETAKIMNKKEGTIRVLQYRGLQNLAAILKSND